MKQPISAGFIQFYNHNLANTITTLNASKRNNIDLIILQFTTWDDFTVNYDKDELLEWSKANDSKMLVGLTGRGSEINRLHRDHSTYWKEEIDDDKINRLIDEDIKIVDDWPNNKSILGFYSSYEPLSTEYVESVGQEYDKYLLDLSNELEKWAEINNRDVVLAFSGAVAEHLPLNEFARREIEEKAKIFSKRISEISKKILTNKNRLKLVFILQDGAGVRNVRNDHLALGVRPFFVEVKKELEQLNNIEFWPLVEAFDKNEEHTSKDSLKLRWENISDLGWNSEKEEKYRVVVFDLPRFNEVMEGD